MELIQHRMGSGRIVNREAENPVGYRALDFSIQYQTARWGSRVSAGWLPWDTDYQGMLYDIITYDICYSTR